MNHHQQRHVDGFARGQHYLDDQASDVAVLKDCDGRKQLDDVLARITASVNEQGTALRQMDGLVSRQRSLVLEVRYRHMQPITTFARARLEGAPDFAALTRSTRRLQPKPLVHAARAMATAAAPHAEALAQGGFPDCIARLTAAADALEATMVDRANTRIAKVRATKDIAEQVKRGQLAITMLHAVVSNLLGHDATFMTGWNAARRAGNKVGRVHGARTTTDSPTTMPATTSVATAQTGQPGSPPEVVSAA
jgi:hypothetical protein